MLVYSSICIDLVVTNFISKMFWGRERMGKKVSGRVGENMIMGCSLYSSIDSYNPIVFSLNRHFYSGFCLSFLSCFGTFF